MLSGKATNTNFMVFGLTRSGLEPTIYALEASKLTITPAKRLIEEGQTTQWPKEKVQKDKQRTPLISMYNNEPH